MSAWAKPGVKCVCVVDGRLPESFVGDAPKWQPRVGETYTVAGTVQFGPNLGLELREQPDDVLWAFSANRFRPIGA